MNMREVMDLVEAPGRVDRGYTSDEVWKALKSDPTIAAKATEENGPWVSRSNDVLVVTGRPFIDRCADALEAAGIPFNRQGYARPYLEIGRDVVRDT